jgi:hypothetical protein
MNNIPIATLANTGPISGIFTNSTLLYLLIFLAIYAVVYFVLGIFYGGSAESGPLRIVRIIDILVLLFVVIFLVTRYWNVNPQTFGAQLSGSLSSFKGFAENPYSIFTVLVFLLAFYAAIYLVQIPMGSVAKPVAIMIVETAAILLFIGLLIIDFFKYLLNIDLLDFIFDMLIKTLNTPAPTTKSPSSSDTPTETIPVCKPATTPPETGEVFNIRNNLYTYDEAREVCSVYGAKLATYDQIEKAYNKGGEWCNYGWSEGQMALFPTQKATWEKLQQGKTACSPNISNNACGRPGINGGVIKNPNIRFGVNCYGKKPPPTDSDKKLMEANVDVKIPETQADRDLAAKMKVWKENADKFMLVNSFNKTKWTNEVSPIGSSVPSTTSFVPSVSATPTVSR